MLKNQLQSKIIQQLTTYEQLLSQQALSKAGDLYELFMYETLKQLTYDREVAEQIIDELLFQTEHPNIQIEMASEAIGLNYRADEALQILEALATWADDMTPINSRGKICSTAQSRLRNLLDYEIDILHNTWTRPDIIKISAVYQQFFNERIHQVIDLQKHKTKITDENTTIALKQLIRISQQGNDQFLFLCTDEENQYIHLLIACNGHVKTVFKGYEKIEPFNGQFTIVLTKELLYGLIDEHNKQIILPAYQHMEWLNTHLLIAWTTPQKGDLYAKNGQLLLEKINVGEVIVNRSISFIYQSKLFNANLDLPIDLSSLGTNWAPSPIIGQFVGYNSNNEPIYINEAGEVIKTQLTNLEDLPIDEFGEVYFTSNANQCELIMDQIRYSLNGEAFTLVKRFENRHFIVIGSWSEGQYLWVNRAKKKFEFYKALHCTDDHVTFVKSATSDYWIALDADEKKILSEKKQIVSVTRNIEDSYFELEDANYVRYYFLPISKKLLKKSNLVQLFIKHNK